MSASTATALDIRAVLVFEDRQAQATSTGLERAKRKQATASVDGEFDSANMVTQQVPQVLATFAGVCVLQLRDQLSPCLLSSLRLN